MAGHRQPGLSRPVEHRRKGRSMIAALSTGQIDTDDHPIGLMRDSQLNKLGADLRAFMAVHADQQSHDDTGVTLTTPRGSQHPAEYVSQGKTHLARQRDGG